MHTKELISLHIEKMKGKGVWSSTVAPPLFRFLWWLGFEIPPPLFLSFFQLLGLMGTSFAIIWGLLMYILIQTGVTVPGFVMALTAMCAGLLFGWFMALFYRIRAESLEVPSWTDFIAAQQNPA